MVSITQAVILAGGEGKRLQPFTLKNPKPMIPVNGKPFLEHLIGLLKDNGVKEVIILTGYLEEKIRNYFGDGSRFGIKIKYSYTPFLNEKGKENQSGLRIKNAQNMLADLFLLLYCDNYWPLKLKNLVDFFHQNKSDVLVTAYSNLDNSTKNNIHIKNGYVTRYDPTRKGKDLNCVEIGFFIVNKKVLNILPKDNSKFENDLLPKLIKKRNLSGYLSDQKYYSIGSLDRVKTTSKFLFPKKVIFLDRDGVINKRPSKADYVKDWKEFKFLPHSIEVIKLLSQNGYKVYIISNQPGIARGALSLKDLAQIHRKMVYQIKASGGKIEGIYYCPHNWNEGCSCRKPKPGLLYKASYDHFIDLTKTIFIGDDERDEEAGKAAGCKTILVSKNNSLIKIAKEIVSQSI